MTKITHLLCCLTIVGALANITLIEPWWGVVIQAILIVSAFCVMWLNAVEGESR